VQEHRLNVVHVDYQAQARATIHALVDLVRSANIGVPKVRYVLDEIKVDSRGERTRAKYPALRVSGRDAQLRAV